MVCRVLGAFLRCGALIGSSLNNYVFIFYFFFFYFGKIFMYGLFESLPACFKKALINPVYPGLDIMV